MASAARPRRTGLRSPPAPEAPKESVVSRLFISPLVFISFLFSLALVDSRNYTFRQHSHNSSNAVPTTAFGRIKDALHPIFFRRISSAPSPYEYVRSPEAKSPVAGERRSEEEPWHWRTHQRKMMKAEMDDAFTLRKSVMFVLMGLSIGSTIAFIAVVGWGWRFFTSKILGGRAAGNY